MDLTDSKIIKISAINELVCSHYCDLNLGNIMACTSIVVLSSEVDMCPINLI